MPLDYLFRPPEIVQKNALGIFESNPYERATRRITKSVANRCKRVQHNINVLAEFAGPQIIMFLNLLRPLSRSSFMDSANVSLHIPFCCSTSSAQESHCPSHPVTHSPCSASSRISMRDFLDRCSISCAVLISHAVVKTSATTRGPLFTINSAMQC